MDSTETHPKPATDAALQLAHWAERNLLNFSQQTHRELKRAATHDEQIKICALGIAICQARAIIRDSLAKVEAA